MYRNRFTRSSVLAAGILLCAVSTTHARLAGNTLRPETLAANSAAASTLAASSLAVEQLGPNTYVVDPVAAGALLATGHHGIRAAVVWSSAASESPTTTLPGRPSRIAELHSRRCRAIPVRKCSRRESGRR